MLKLSQIPVKYEVMSNDNGERSFIFSIVICMSIDINNGDWQLIEISQNPAVPIVKCSQFKLVYISNQQLYRYINS